MTSPVPDATVDTAAAKDSRDASMMQRVRVGITGLAAVFLLTLLAAAVYSFFGSGDQHATQLANGVVVANTMGNSEEAPKEPLAELGMAPGGNTPKPQTTVTPHPAAQAPARPADPANSPAH